MILNTRTTRNVADRISSKVPSKVHVYNVHYSSTFVPSYLLYFRTFVLLSYFRTFVRKYFRTYESTKVLSKYKLPSKVLSKVHLLVVLSY